MAKKFLIAIDLSKNELQNPQMHNLASAPGSPVKGQMYMNTTDNIMYWWNGSAWIAAQGGTVVVPGTTVTTAAIGDAAVVGAAAPYSREDHKHGMPAFGSVTAQTSFSAASGNGAAVTISRADHAHGTPAHDSTAHASIPLSALSSPFGTVVAQTSFGGGSINGAQATASRSDHQHGTPTHAAGDHSTIPLNSFAAPTLPVNFGGQKINSLGDPLVATDGATKQYVDNLTMGVAWKDAVRVATTANITLSGTGQSIDGISPAGAERVLVKNQTNAAENGIYIVSGGAWSRAEDADSASDLLNTTVFVSEGTTQADTAWVGTANAPITVGSTLLPFVQFGAGTAYVGGAGLTLSGSTFAVGAGSGVTVNADDVAVTWGGNGAAVTAARSDHNHDAAYSPIAHNHDTTYTKKFAANLTASASQAVTHNLNTRDVSVNVYRNSTPWDTVECDIERTDVNNVTLRFATAPSASEYRAVVVA